MESLDRLRTLLNDAFTGGPLPGGEQELFDELITNKPAIINLLNAGPRSSSEQRELENGKILLNGRIVTINTEFARSALFLSQFLDCSERYTASLLYAVTREYPNLDQVQYLETTVQRFHERRRHLLSSLLLLLQTPEASTDPNTSPVVSRLAHFVQQQVSPYIPAQSNEISLAARITKQIEALSADIAKNDAALRQAGSTTIIPTGQGNSGFSSDFLEGRSKELRSERRLLGLALCLIARMGSLAANDVKSSVEWLSTNPNHAMTFYYLTAIFLAFEPVDPQSHGGLSRRALINDKLTVAFLARKMQPANKDWKDPGMKAAVLLKWTLLLIEYRACDRVLENREGFSPDELETQLSNGIQGDAFQYLSHAIFQLHSNNGALRSTIVNNLILSSEQQEERAAPDEDVKTALLGTIEQLSRSLVRCATPTLKRIKKVQEDKLATSRIPAQSLRFSGHLNRGQNTANEAPRNDVATFLSFLGYLYAGLPPERGLQFWDARPLNEDKISFSEEREVQDPKLPAFLQWAITGESDPVILTALFDMLAGISKGRHCSELAHNFMARGFGEVIQGSSLASATSAGPISWKAVFLMLESWIPTAVPQMAATRGPFNVHGQTAHSVQANSVPQMSQQDVLLAQASLTLLATCVSCSVAVRLTIADHAQFRAIPTLVSILNLPIPLELKGALFDTLSAFATPGGGLKSVDICHKIWSYLERCELIEVRPQTPAFGIMPPRKGLVAELEDVESSARRYPSTIPFIRLLANLVYTSKRVPFQDRGLTSSTTIPDSLGQPYRHSGIWPYVEFVIDSVFSRIASREYLWQEERWQMNDVCLCFIERTIASYELEPLVDYLSSPNSFRSKKEVMAPFLVHPGYDLMSRILSRGNLQSILQGYLVEGLAGFGNGVDKTQPYFLSTIVRVLRISLRVLEIQDIFLDVLVPSLSEFDSESVIGKDHLHPRSFFTRFDEALSFHPQNVTAIATYTTFSVDSEMTLLAVKILSLLSASLQNLPTLVERSPESNRILSSFVSILGNDNSEDVDFSESEADHATGAGAPDPNDQVRYAQATRLAVLDLLTQNTIVGGKFPNLSHFLLFGGLDKVVEDPHALGSRKSCIHVILDLVNQGVPRLRDKSKLPESAPLFLSLPSFAERCYRIIYNLCIHPRTTDFVMRYLRTRDNFFARQLSAVTDLVPEALGDPYIQIIYNDGTRVTSTISVLTAFLQLRSWIFDLTALELHVLTVNKQIQSTSELIDILFGSRANEGPDNSWDLVAFQPFREVGQSQMRVLEFVQSLVFDWADSLTVGETDLKLLSGLNLQACIKVDSSGCDVVDRTALLAILTSAKAMLYAEGKISTNLQSQMLETEIAYILQSCAVENNRRRVTQAIATSYAAWHRMLDVSLTKCFTYVPEERRESVLFDLLHAILSVLISADVEDSTALLISANMLSCFAKLRENRYQQIVETGALPTERLLTIFRSLLQCCIENRRSELVRGNLYGSLINYAQLVSNDVVNRSSESDGSLRILTWSEPVISSFGAGGDGPMPKENASQLLTGSLSLLQSSIDKLTATVSRDASDGSDVWKTVAFVLLDSLSRLSTKGKQNLFIDAISRQGILSNFIRGIKEADLHLQVILRPNPDDLNALYVYESKMTFFIGITQTRPGAERLIDSRIIPALAQCDFIDARPDNDEVMQDEDFLPSPMQRYHQLLLPSLQLVNSILSTIGTKHATLANQVLDFLTSHGATLVILLKSNIEDIPLSYVEEISLVVSLCSCVFIHAGAELSSSTSGIGAIHSAVMAFAAKYLPGRHWIDNMRPQTSAELIKANISTSGLGYESQFDAEVRRTQRLLLKSLISYLGSTSHFSEPELLLVLSPNITESLPSKRGSNFATSMPSLDSALIVLEDLCAEYSDVMRRISDLSADLDAKDQISIANLQDIFVDIDPVLLEDLDIMQKRRLVSRELERIRLHEQEKARSLSDCLEMMLLLVWRHISHYSEAENLDNSPMRGSILDHDLGSFKSEAAQRISPILQQLYPLISTASELKNWVPDHRYAEVITRRLRDSVSLDFVDEERRITDS